MCLAIVKWALIRTSVWWPGGGLRWGWRLLREGGGFLALPGCAPTPSWSSFASLPTRWSPLPPTSRRPQAHSRPPFHPCPPIPIPIPIPYPATSFPLFLSGAFLACGMTLCTRISLDARNQNITFDTFFCRHVLCVVGKEQLETHQPFTLGEVGPQDMG